MRTTSMILLATALAAIPAIAQPTSSSASYTLLHAPAGDIAGGGPVVDAGGTVTAEVSTGDLASGAVSEVTPLGVEAKGNLIGQLYDVTAVTVTAVTATLDEGGTRQLGAGATMDDATTLALAGPEVGWSVVAGAVTGIDANGLATAGLVYEPTAATVRGSYFGVDGDLVLTVLDADADNYLEYAGDGIDDDWQVNFFGEPPNDDAGPGENPDNDPDDNLGEFLFGFSPVDPLDFFRLTADKFSGPAVFDLRLNKVIPGRSYTVTSSPDLATPFAPVGASFSVPGEEANRLFQDPTATGDKNLYRVEVTRP